MLTGDCDASARNVAERLGGGRTLFIGNDDHDNLCIAVQRKGQSKSSISACAAREAGFGVYFIHGDA
jgi:hypothetical protein